jgi:hypothetical protein
MDDKLYIDRLINENVLGLYGHLYAGAVTNIIVSPGEPRADPSDPDAEPEPTIDVILVYNSHPEGKHPDLDMEVFNVTGINFVGIDVSLPTFADFEIDEEQGDEEDRVGLAEIEVFNGWCRRLVITGKSMGDPDILCRECGSVPPEEEPVEALANETREKDGENHQHRMYVFNMVKMEYLDDLEARLDAEVYPRWIIFSEFGRDTYFKEAALDNISELGSVRLSELLDLPETTFRPIKQLPPPEQIELLGMLVEHLDRHDRLREMLMKDVGEGAMIGAVSEPPLQLIIRSDTYYAYKLL